MSNGRKLGLSGLTSLSLDSLEAGVGSMTDSRPFGYYSYFFRMFRTLAFEANVRLGGEWYDASPSKSSFVSRGSAFFEIFAEGPRRSTLFWAEILDGRADQAWPALS